MKLHETSFLYALVRFILIGVFFYFIKKASKDKKDYFFSDFLLINISKYASVSILIVFLLVQFKSYNLFNYLSLVSVFLLFDLYNFNSPKVIYSSIKNSFEKLTIESVSFIEAPNKKQIIRQFFSSKKLTPNELYDLSIILFIIMASFVVRMLFYTNDLFLFSESWFNDFEKVTQILNQQWFTIDYTEMGEYALISLFSLFFKVSSGMSLQMFGFLQSIILSMLIYWVVKTVSLKDKNLIPLLSAIIFLGGFVITPIDITFIFEHRKIFTVLFILIPVLVCLAQKQHFYRYKIHLIYTFLALFAISFLAFSSLGFLILPAFLFIFLYDGSKTLQQRGILILSPFFIASCTLILFFILFNYGQFNLNYFFKNSFIEVSNFTKIQNQYFTYKNIIKLSSLLATLVIIINILSTKINIISVVISSLYLSTSALYQTNYYLFDENLFLLIFSVLTPIIIGISMTQLVMNKLPSKKVKYPAFLALVFVIFSLIYIQKTPLQNLKSSNETNRQLLAVYDKIITNHLPYSYAVTNHQKAMVFSRTNHYFINYKELNKSYIEKDSVFHLNKKEKDFFKKNPQAILPNSIFLFEILGVDKNVSRIGFLTNKNQLKKNDSILKILKSRNREIVLYTNTDRLRVYKIINHENSSNVDQMLFYDKRL
ncbi:hypothetical protein ACQY1Q_12820 [Tenacibaculum sp. TC6]|uniref:hypothetical protein n=1 Tax=Tenacibaculum sp. TC6 TaxID=3423223 RepID=UPI003D362E38